MHIYCDQVWRTHKGAVSGGTARPRHEAASRLRHLKRIEAVRQMAPGRIPAIHSTSVSSQHELHPTTAPTINLDAQFEHSLATDATLHATFSPNAATPDLASEFAEWDQFASMVSSGLGNLDVFLNEYQFGQIDNFPLIQ